MFKAILFDIDGTLLDTAPGVISSARHAIREMGFAPLPEAALRKFVGPPPRETYRALCQANEEQALRAALLHRQYGRERGLYDSRPYPGIPELVEALWRAGAKLGAATLKAQDVAEKILEHHALRRYLGAVVGVDAGETRTKADTIHLALQALGASPGEAVLVGDSEYDRAGAHLAGVQFAGVSWGYGFPPGTPGMARDAEELKKYLFEGENR